MNPSAAKAMSPAALAWMDELAAPLRARLDADPVAALPLPAIPQSLEAALLLGLLHSGSRSVIWITDGPQAMDSMFRNLRTLDAEDAVERLAFPPHGSGRDDLSSIFVARDRLATLATLAATPVRPVLVLSCVEAVLQPCPEPASIRENHRLLSVGEAVERDDLVGFLQRTGHDFVQEVTEPGQAAMRGGIFDLWPLRESHPYRIEFFESVIDSIRIFDPVDQRSIARRPALHVGMAAETTVTGSASGGGRFSDYWPAAAAIVWSRPSDIERHTGFLQAAERSAAGSESPADALLRLRARIESGRHPQIYLPAPEALAVLTDVLPADIRFIEGVIAPSDAGFQPDAAERQRRAFVQRLVVAARAGTDVGIYFNTGGALTHFRKTFINEFGAARIRLESGWLSDGFHLPAMGRMLIGEDLLYGRGKARRAQAGLLPGTAAARVEGVAAAAVGARLTDWSDIQPGDLVVHAGHGIGRYQGLQSAVEGQHTGEFMIVEYAEGARLYVPAAQAHLLSRYIGGARHGVALHRLGGTRWNRERHAAARAIEDLAASFVEIQAARQTLPGHAFTVDPPWFHDFEAAFPFDATVDQAQAIADVLRDMEAPRPMDRLICGDAGYGKTEVAMRAAFKAVMDGKQVAVFVPTTVLAQQHYYTFSERMASYPVTIDALSRFSSEADRRRVTAGLRAGGIDIVIGTHALLHRDIVFHDLGLVVIDEEQRFGVMHKERFKQIRRMVDVLTLTATPIPRTLYLSLTGVRELSAIRTPPRDRLAIETEIAEFGDAPIRRAILRELNRDGQVFFLHNRVHSIERMVTRLRGLVPEARIEVAHGQMAARALPEIMRRFAAGQFDVLLCTTIIESGVDIPSANTIIVDRADRFGVAELYQLRGRVGRSGVRAHALLLLPRQGLADPLARKRVATLQEYSHPGAGFELALRDLEIRGAGNLLGAEQSGHITAIGFSLYCQLLQRTVARLKGEPAPPLAEVDLRLDFIKPAGGDSGSEALNLLLPSAYIGGERDRMRFYRRLAETVSLPQISALRDELRDRYGPLPLPVVRLLTLAELRVAAAARGIQAIETDNGKVMLRRAEGYVMSGKRFPRLHDGSIDARLAALRELVEQL